MSIQTWMGSVIPVTNKSERSAISLLKLAFLILVFVAVFDSLWSGLQDDPGLKNLYVQQAQAFLQGHLDLNQYFHDTAVYQGHYYVPFPPFPAILLVPFVVVLGPTATKGVLISLGLSFFNVVIFVQILKKLKLEAELIPWITAAFFLGTSYWMSVVASRGVWFLAHIVAVTCLLLAVQEALGTGRGIVTGLFLGMAILSRQTTVCMMIFLGTALWINPRFTTVKAKLTNLIWFIIPLLLFLAGYLGFNWVRFDHPFDLGYVHIFDVPYDPAFLQARVQKYGLFHPVYIPFNFVNMFLQGFHIEFKPPFYISGMEMDGFGTSLTFASPFVFIAFWAKWKRPLLRAAWLSIGLALIQILMYHGNGYLQVNGQRYALDFLPIVMLLVALGLKQVPTHIWKGAIIYSILLNVLALFLIPVAAEIMSTVARLI